MTPVEQFVWGFAGSVAVEIVSLGRHYDDGQLDLPARYYRVGFYVVRILLATVGGGLAVAYNVALPLLAGHVGAATPLIMKALGDSVPAAVRNAAGTGGNK